MAAVTPWLRDFPSAWSAKGIYDIFSDHMNARLGRKGCSQGRIDAAVRPEGATTELALDLARIAPLGLVTQSRIVLPSASYRESGCGWRKPCPLFKRMTGDVESDIISKPGRAARRCLVTQTVFRFTWRAYSGAGKAGRGATNYRSVARVS